MALDLIELKLIFFNWLIWRGKKDLIEFDLIREKIWFWFDLIRIGKIMALYLIELK